MPTCCTHGFRKVSPVLTEARNPCPQCGTPNLTSARFCKSCGSGLKSIGTCSGCKTTLPAGARFCPSCGLPTSDAGPAGAAAAATTGAPNGNENARDKSSADRIAPASAETPPSVPSSQEALAAVSKLQKQKHTAVGIGVNVLTLVAVVFAFVVIMVRMTKDAPKSVSPFQGGPPPSSAGSGSGGTEASAAGGQGVTGTVELDPSLSAHDPRGTLFVTLRPAGTPPVGPPLAVQKLANPSLPVAFRVGPENVMLKGMPFTGPFDVYARLDADGNAMTKEPTDVEAPPLRGVLLGAEVKLLLGGKAAESPPPSEPAPPPAPPTAPSPPPAASADALSGEVQVSAELVGHSGRGTLYIMVRKAGVPGPPIAVKRLASPSFPSRFEIGPGDVMMQGTPLVGPFDLSARLDQDGDPMTKAPGDLVTKTGLTGIQVGAAAIVLTLDEKL